MSSFGIIIYTDINSATSPDESTLSNPLVFYIKVLRKIAAPRSVIIESALYTNVVNSSFIISIISLVKPFSFFIATITCFNNTVILTV